MRDIISSGIPNTVLIRDIKLHMQVLLEGYFFRKVVFLTGPHYQFLDAGQCMKQLSLVSFVLGIGEGIYLINVAAKL